MANTALSIHIYILYQRFQFSKNTIPARQLSKSKPNDHFKPCLKLAKYIIIMNINNQLEHRKLYLYAYCITGFSYAINVSKHVTY